MGLVVAGERRLGPRHRRRRHVEPEFEWIQQVLLDKPPADLDRQVGQRQRRQSGPCQRRPLLRFGADERAEQAGLVVLEPLDDRGGQRGPAERRQ
jgi:hypothetical protein